MAHIKTSDYLGVTDKQLDKADVLNAVLGIDSNLFVDPHLLQATKVPEFQGARKKIEKYFSEIVTLLSASTRVRDRAWLEARRRLTFTETRGVSIGYGVKSSDGRAVGVVLAIRLTRSAKEIIEMGIKDPAIFELLGLFEEDFGADRLSDVAISILQQEFIEYTARISSELKIKSLKEFKFKGKSYKLPPHPDGKNPLVFVPKSILRDLPVALTYDDIYHVASVNREVRDELNSLVGGAWTKSKNVTKKELRNIIFANPENIRTLLKSYKSNPGGAYDFDDDPGGHINWFEIGKAFATSEAISLSSKKLKTLGEVEEIVDKIVKQFKKHIEVNGLNEHLYAHGKRRPERFSQRLFYSVADSYCEANNVGLNREPNAGNGPVDFKVNSGYEANALVEIKLSSNPKLLQGYAKQIEAYKESEGTKSCHYVVIRVTDSEEGIKRLLEYRDELAEQDVKCSPITVIDGTIKTSASKR